MYNRPSSKNRYQQEPTMESINLKEKQLYLQSSSINPLTGAVLRQDQQQYNYQQNNQNLDKKVALQASSINPLTGAPVMRNPISYPPETAQQKFTPYGVAANQNVYSTSAGQIGAPSNMNNDAQFQKNLVKFFAADDPNPVQQRNQNRSNNAMPSDPQFQRNLVKFFAADDPTQINRPTQNRSNPSRQNQSQANYQNQYASQGYPQQQRSNQNDPQFQQNLAKFFAADDPTVIQKPKSRQQQSNQQQTYQQQGYQQQGYQQQGYQQQGYSQQQARHQSQPSNDMSLDPRLANDPSFQKNLGKFFAADDPSQPKKQYQSKQAQQQQQINAIEQNKLQRLEQDPRFQKNLQQFFGVDGNQQQMKNGQGVSNAIQQLNKTNKVVAITDSSSVARNQVAAFFRTRGIDDFDVFTTPGGVFGLQNNQVWEQSLQYYLETLNNAYNIKEVYIISVLDNNTNARIYTNVNDKRSHQIAIQDLKSVLENKLNVQFKLNGIIIDQRGASEKVF